MQGLVAVGGGDDVVGRALAYIRARQRGDGSVAYSATSNQTPVWVTAQALLALRRAPFPLDPVPRKRQKRKASAKPSSERQHGAPDGRPAPRPRTPDPGPQGREAGGGGAGKRLRARRADRVEVDLR